MKIGCIVEDNNHYFFLNALKEKWNLESELINFNKGEKKLQTIHSRSDAELSSKRKIRGTRAQKSRSARGNPYLILKEKDCDIIIVLKDSDKDRWQDAKRRENQNIPEEYKNICIIGIPERNIEYWIGIDSDFCAQELQIDDPRYLKDALKKDDKVTVSGIIKEAIKGRIELVKEEFQELSSVERTKKAREKIINEFIEKAVLHDWIISSPSFVDFFDEIRRKSKAYGCNVPNEKEKE